MRALRRVLFLVPLLVGGCASPNQVVWWRDDFSPEEFADDSALCLNYAGAKAEGQPGAQADADRRKDLTKQFYDYCLASLGYYQVELHGGRLPPPPPPPPEQIDIRYRPEALYPPARRPADL